ncbi:hypothetical protein [Erythrobacter aureus]|uniref:hypothetical protein n=1 Tax=Erythrobacter aureus TaxID=2182384 RepID=UPI003A92ED9C
MRPVSILWFERLFLLSLVLVLVNSVVQYDAFLAQIRSDPALAAMGPGNSFAVGVIAISLLIPLILWYFIARRASVIAKWMLVVLTAFGLLFVNFDPATMFNPARLTSLVVTVLQLAAIALLFRADARAWLSRTDDHAAP